MINKKNFMLFEYPRLFSFTQTAYKMMMLHLHCYMSIFEINKQKKEKICLPEKISNFGS